ncbi:hypothetical protein CLOM_g17314 [Closterium sp. NIES-68]|nr:hypothetical protein CLOM_g17314 [Closterium sp. NIES-68]GJP62873.1 hypothetical protein CLOP_g19945 [Closterium sp. NIES-67]
MSFSGPFLSPPILPPSPLSPPAPPFPSPQSAAFPSPSSYPPPLPSAYPPFLPPPPLPSAEGFCLAWQHPHASLISRTWFAIVTVAPPLLFLLFLLSRVRPALAQLRRARSAGVLGGQCGVMAGFYALLWAAAGTNLARTLAQLLVLSPAAAAPASTHWVSAAWLAAGCVGVCVEAGVVVFLLHPVLMSASEALLRTALIAAILAAADTALQASLVFHHAVPLFSPALSSGGAGAAWAFWLAHDACRAAVYAALLALPLSHWRDALPAGPAFHRYVFLLLLLHACSALACLLLALHASAALCIRGLAVYLYTACFPPLLYATFLADFFKDEDAAVEDAYYSEMRDAGYFDADGDWD